MLNVRISMIRWDRLVARSTSNQLDGHYNGTREPQVLSELQHGYFKHANVNANVTGHQKEQKAMRAYRANVNLEDLENKESLL